MTDAKTDSSEAREGQRIAKVMARVGLCSRRDAEAWIAEGRVSVNGEVLKSPAFNVNDDDDIRVDGARLGAPERTRLFFFHKPRGLVTTARDPEGRPTIFSALPPDLPRVVAIGRLDINTEGLLLLTNDGGLARVLELPATGWLRRYRVRAHGEVTQAQLDALREGVTIEGINYLGIEARLEREQGSNVWIMMGLREGKNREIKRVLEHLGLSVNRLIRVSFGPFELGELEEGAVAELNTRILRDQLGLKLAKQAAANFDAPIEVRKVPPTPVPDRELRRPVPGGDRPVRRPREDKAAIAAELAARGERHETKNPRKRKHISILRAEARAEAAGPRTRVERGATADRKGREVKVERISKARAPEAAIEASPPRASPPRREYAGKRDHEAAPRGRSGPKREFGEKREFGDKREFGAKRDGAPAREGRPFRSAPRSAEGGRADRSGPEREGRPFRAAATSAEGRPARSGPSAKFGEKRQGAPAREGRPFRSAPRSSEGSRAERSGPAREGRPPRGASTSAEGRPARSGPGAKFAPPRGEGAPAREGRPFRSAPKSAEGRPARPGPKREFSGKGRPGGKPAGKRPPRKP